MVGAFRFLLFFQQMHDTSTLVCIYDRDLSYSWPKIIGREIVGTAISDVFSAQDKGSECVFVDGVTKYTH